MSVIAVLLFVAVTSYGNNLGKAPIQLNKDKICNKSKTMERDTIKLHIGSKVFVVNAGKAVQLSLVHPAYPQK